MEQSETSDDTLRSIQLPRSHPSSSTSPQSTPRLANSEPNPEPPNIEDLSDSVLSLRFPRPVGNRQLTNWVSSSSPDIMQPGNVLDVDPSLTELGYDIIGTDGESQAESIASSFDYQKSDGIQSLTGTDVDTDSSDDEENNLNETTISDATIVEQVHYEDAAEAEALNMANQNLENPTSLSLSNSSPFKSLSYLDHIRTHEPTAVIRGQSYAVDDLPLSEQPEALSAPLTVKELEHLGSSPPLPKELATVPVASVSVVTPLPSAKTTYSVTSPTPTTSQTLDAVQSASSPNGLIFIPFGKENTQTDVAAVPALATICLAELSGRDEIMIRIPQNLKSSWLAKDAILIAVSRGLQDIPTKVSSIDVGFLIQVPVKEAHGVLAVTIATTRKPIINESFRINFGTYRFTEALDAGKQLVRGFAQRVVDTVNGTTFWVEETYIPALDVVSRQVCDQTVSVSGSVLHSLRDASDSVLAIPSHLIAQMQRSLDASSLLRRISQFQLEFVREAQDVRDELRMAMLTSQINSKLMWLTLQGKAEEHGQYLNKAQMHWKEQRTRIESARVERAERTKKQIRTRHQRDRPISKGSFWSTMGAWVGFEE
ncbi:hypothetical protein E0Z10_g4085 [Xylaria hypoxylon]|uniref:Uncharacterized protein n=1 Tax=Xylaria hypoxylon TaxID=37992 RepID=A0A4Z0YLY4_9PEZI|nr:hypothetical protein E0Z10_g4085 [Xylaria hypoxylon]